MWEELSAGPLPYDAEDRRLLVRYWLSEPEKPTGGGDPTEIHRSGTSWPILKWLVGYEEEMRRLLKDLQKRDPPLAAMLAEEVMRRGKCESHAFERPYPYSGAATG